MALKKEDPQVVGFGIIGAGVVAPWHAKAIESTENAKLIAIASRTEARAKHLAGQFGVDGYGDYRYILDRKDIDAVTICTPSGTHAEIAIECAKSGKHILVEKPLEITLDRCDAIINAAKAANVTLGVVFQSRFMPAAMKVKEALEKSKLGKLFLADVYIKWYRTQNYYDSGGWRGTWWGDGGGCLMNQGIHGIDLLYWFAGPVDSVIAYTDIVAHERIEVEDLALALLKFKSGAMGVIEGSTACYPGAATRHELHGTDGTIILEETRILKWEFKEPTEEDKNILRQFYHEELKVDRSDPTAVLAEAHRPVIQDFTDAIIKNCQPAVTGEEGRKSVEIILSIYQSAKEKRVVALP